MRHHSVRGLGIRYLIAVTLPISGAILVVYTAFQLVVAHATNTVPPPRRIAEAQLPDNFSPPPVETYQPSEPALRELAPVPPAVEPARHELSRHAEPEPTTKSH